jgi:hypothetical protein
LASELLQCDHSFCKRQYPYPVGNARGPSADRNRANTQSVKTHLFQEAAEGMIFRALQWARTLSEYRRTEFSRQHLKLSRPKRVELKDIFLNHLRWKAARTIYAQAGCSLVRKVSRSFARGAVCEGGRERRGRCGCTQYPSDSIIAAAGDPDTAAEIDCDAARDGRSGGVTG